MLYGLGLGILGVVFHFCLRGAVQGWELGALESWEVNGPVDWLFLRDFGG